MLFRTKNFFLLLIIALCLSNYSRAEIRLSLPDSTLDRGKLYQINLTGVLQDIAVTNAFSIVLKYDARLIHIISIQSGNEFAYQCDKPGVKFDYTNQQAALAEISCNKVLAINGGSVLLLNIEALAGSDSIAKIEVVKVINNGTELPITSNKAGIYKINGPLIFPKVIEGIGQNYPNPFNYSTTFQITIEKQSSVKWLIYSTDGRAVITSENDPDMFTLISKKDNSKKNISEPIVPGSYDLQFVPNGNIVSSGPYYLLMITDKGTYNLNFLYLK